MKRKISILLIACLAAVSLAACGGGQGTAGSGSGSEAGTAASGSGMGTEALGEAPGQEAGEENDGEPVSLTLWTYPVGDWKNATKVSSLLRDFRKAYPAYNLTVEYLDYTTGDDKVREAVENGTLPDLVLEGPERLVADWGAKGLMADLSDLWKMDAAEEIYEPVRNACRYGGAYYEFPFFMTAHCMAVNRDLFEKAGALQYVDEENHTWSTEGFIKAVEALKAYGQEKVGIVYCGGQGGDQGTRALVNNLYGGSFSNKEHTGYDFEGEENIRALQLLRDLDGIVFDPEHQGGDEVTMFGSGELAMAFCWNVSMEVNQTVNNPNLDFDILPLTFPTEDGKPTLQGGIWGFGVFDNGDEARIQAAKDFIRFYAEDDGEYAQTVLISSYWPVRDVEGIYVNDALMTEYGIFTQYMGDYYQVTPGWASVRTAWWTMLQEIGGGAEISEAVAEFEETADRAAREAGGE